MSTKMLDATCSASSKVTAAGVEVPGAQVLSAGKKASSGVLLLERDQSRYLTSNASDIKDLTVKLGALIDQLKTVLTGIDGATSTPGGQAAGIAQLTTIKTEITQLGEALK